MKKIKTYLSNIRRLKRINKTVKLLLKMDDHDLAAVVGNMALEGRCNRKIKYKIVK